MSTLYIDRKNSAIRVARQTLELCENDKVSQRIPFSLLQRIVIVGNLHTQTGVLTALADAGISVVLLSGRQQRHKAMLLGPLKNDGVRRLAQYRACCDAAITQAIVICLLKRKLASQQRLLHKALMIRPDKRHILKKSIKTIAELRAKLRIADTSLASLRGLEGAAAAAYFGSYAELLPKGIGFNGRKRRPPPDPVNAALSLGYALMYGEAVNAIYAAGLDPALGYLHEPAWGRHSLAADLIEPLRSRHDEMVWRLFAERQLKPTNFDYHHGGCWLNKKGRAIFFPAYETAAAPSRRWLRRFLHALIQKLQQ